MEARQEPLLTVGLTLELLSTALSGSQGQKLNAFSTFSFYLYLVELQDNPALGRYRSPLRDGK